MDSARTSTAYWTKLCAEIIYRLSQAFVLLLTASNILSKDIFSNNTEHRKKNFNVSTNSTESLKKREIFAYSL